LGSIQSRIKKIKKCIALPEIAVYCRGMKKNDIKDYTVFKITQYFRLKGIKIPKEIEAQRQLLATIPQKTKKQWAMEMIYMGA